MLAHLNTYLTVLVAMDVDPVGDELHRAIMERRQSGATPRQDSPVRSVSGQRSPSPLYQTQTPPQSDSPSSPAAELVEENPAKRRRLEPTFVGPVQIERSSTVRELSPDTIEPVPEPEQEASLELEPNNKPEYIPDPSKKRIAPTLIAPLDDSDLSEAELQLHQDVEMIDADRRDPVQRKARQRNKVPCYLDRIHVNDILFSTSVLGEELDNVEVKHPRQFALFRNSAAPGTRRVVSRNMRRLMFAVSSVENGSHNTDVLVMGPTASGKRRAVFRPFDKSLQLDIRDTDNVLVVDIDDHDILSAFLVDNQEFKFPWGEQGPPGLLQEIPKKRNILAEVGRNETWDVDLIERLEQRYGNVKNDTILPPFNESGDEEDYDSETYREMDEEAEQKARRDEKGLRNGQSAKGGAAALSQGDVLEFIEEGIVILQRNWELQEKPKQERKAFRIWTEHAQAKTRKRERTYARDRIEEIKPKIQDQKKEILDNEWYRRKDVIKQCKSLEVFVWQMEEYKWLINLLDRKTAPDAPLRTKSAKKKKAPKLIPLDEPSSDEGDASEESLGSDSDIGEGYSSGSESDGGFVVSDPSDIELDDAPDAPLESDSEIEEPALPSRTDKLPSPIIKQRHSPSFTPPVVSAGASQGRAKSQPSAPHEVIDLLTDSDSDSRRRKRPITRAPSKQTRPLLARGSSSLSQVINKRDAREMLQSLITKKNSEGLLDYFVNKFTSKQLMAIKAKLTEVLFKDLMKRCMSYYKSLKDDQRRPSTSSIDSPEKWVANVYAKCTLFLDRDPTELSHEDVNQLQNHSTMQLFMKALKERVEDSLLEKNGKHETSEQANESETEGDDTPIAPSQPSTSALGSTRNASVSTRVRAGQQSRGFTRESSVMNWDEYDEPIRPHRRIQRAVAEDKDSRKIREQNDKAMALRARRLIDHQKKGGADALSMINPGVNKKFGTEIYFPEELAAKLKVHQVEGIQFLWAQLVETSQSGALLSHTMGLGKTLQVISFLDSLTRAGNSKEKKVISQVPEHLRGSPQILILCPAGLVQNWEDEFNKWLGKDSPLLPVRSIGSEISIKERFKMLQLWEREGGPLLMGYALFRRLFIDKAVSEEDKQHVRRILLEGTKLVIADEAHEIKNSASKISVIVKQFKTMSRIAMTGSPLSNNLKEYFNMIDWIHPKYLGDWKEFDNKYVIPITNGLYTDSTEAERKDSYKVLQALNVDVRNKVHRRDISAIKDFLPSKKEYLISMPLTPLQHEMYCLFLEVTREEREQGTDRYGIWDFVSNLQFIVNHPKIFMDYIRSRNKKDKTVLPAPTTKHADDSAGDAEGESEPAVTDAETIAPGIAGRAEALVTGKNLAAEEHSYRIVLLKKIVQETLKEKKGAILIFTHFIKTLDYLEDVLKSWNYGYVRLDGQSRVGSRQQMCADFNANARKRIMIISTKAGGLGLNLQGANRVVIYDCGWSPAVEEQAVGRAYRLGQKNPVFVYRFMAGGTFEAQRRNKTEFKLQLATKVIDRKDRLRVSSRNNKKYQAPPEEVLQEDLSEFKGKDNVLDALLTSPEGAHVRAIEETETFVNEVMELDEKDMKDVQDMIEQAAVAREHAIAAAKLQRSPKDAGSIKKSEGKKSSPKPKAPTPPLPVTGNRVNVPSHLQNSVVGGSDGKFSSDDIGWEDANMQM